MADSVARHQLVRSPSQGVIPVVDDNPGLWERLMPRLFRSTHFIFEFVTTSEEALVKIKDHRYVGVFLDFYLATGDPENGETLARKIRDMDFVGFIFSISSNDETSKELLDRRVAAGMNAVLGKAPLFSLERFQMLHAQFLKS